MRIEIAHLAVSEPNMWGDQYRLCAPSIRIDPLAPESKSMLCPACLAIGSVLYERDTDGTVRARTQPLGG